MLVELGTPSPVGRHNDPEGRPVVTYMRIPDSLSFDRDVDAEEWRRHLQASLTRPGSGNGITSFEGGEVLCQLTHPAASFGVVSNTEPTWAWSDDPDVARFLGDYYGIPTSSSPDKYDSPELAPLVIEDTHWRRVGRNTLPPGVTVAPVTALLTNVGVNMLEGMVGGGSPIAASVPPVNGKGTAASATTFTTNATLATNAYAGATVYAADTTNNSIVYGNIISNTNAAGASVLTIDAWYTAGGAAGTTPAAGFEFFIVWATPPWLYMGVTTTNITPAVTDTSLSGEATTLGMARKQATFTFTAASGGSAAFTISTTFTFTGSSATTFFAMGLFSSSVKTDTTDTMPIETSFSGSFTVTNNGDQATVTDTITAS